LDLNWGTYVGIAAIVVALFGQYKNSSLNKRPARAVVDAALMALALVAIFLVIAIAIP
jgi:hypothetical protein